MNTDKKFQNTDFREISLTELNAINGGNIVAMAGLIIGGIKFAMDASYSIGYAVGYYVASHE